MEANPPIPRTCTASIGGGGDPRLRLEHSQVTCVIVDSEGELLRRCGGQSPSPSCHIMGSMMPPVRSRSRQSFTSADTLPSAHSAWQGSDGGWQGSAGGWPGGGRGRTEGGRGQTGGGMGCEGRGHGHGHGHGRGHAYTPLLRFTPARGPHTVRLGLGLGLGLGIGLGLGLGLGGSYLFADRVYGAVGDEADEHRDGAALDQQLRVWHLGAGDVGDGPRRFQLDYRLVRPRQ